jgi:hypothetical protein
MMDDATVSSGRSTGVTHRCHLMASPGGGAPTLAPTIFFHGLAFTAMTLSHPRYGCGHGRFVGHPKRLMPLLDGLFTK